MDLNALIAHLQDLVREQPDRGRLPVRVAVDCHEWERDVEPYRIVDNGDTIDIEI